MVATSPTERPSFDEYYLTIARAVSLRGDCTRRQVGCIIVSADMQEGISIGYNGHESGGASCLAGECPRGRHYRVEVPHYITVNAQGDTADIGPDIECACGNDWPCSESVPAGSSYDEGPGLCRATHSEDNALRRAGSRASGATLYCTDEPCYKCWELIREAGIIRVVTPAGSVDISS